MAGLAAVHLSADYTLCVLDGDPSFAVLHEGDDPYNSEEENDPENDEYEFCRIRRVSLTGAQSVLPVLTDDVNGAGESCDDTRKQEYRDTVADTEFVDLLAEPHHQRGARGEYQHDNDSGEDDFKAAVVAGDAHVLQIEEVSGTLDKTERDRYVTGDCADLLSAGLAFFGKSFQSGDSYAEKLHDNGAVDVGGDTHCEDGGVRERAARKGVEISDHVVAHFGGDVVRAHRILESNCVDEGNGDNRTDPEHNDD